MRENVLEVQEITSKQACSYVFSTSWWDQPTGDWDTWEREMVTIPSPM